MIIDLESIFNVEGSFVDLDYEIDLSGEELDGAYPFKTPVRVFGRVSNIADVVEIHADVTSMLTIPCSRCAAEFAFEHITEVDHTLVRQVNDDAGNDDDLIEVTELKYDVNPLITEDIFLSLPYKFLCSEDCKGVCARCGKNLNDGPCDCKKETDPRFDVLKQLLDN